MRRGTPAVDEPSDARGEAFFAPEGSETNGGIIGRPVQRLRERTAWSFVPRMRCGADWQSIVCVRACGAVVAFGISVRAGWSNDGTGGNRIA